MFYIKALPTIIFLSILTFGCKEDEMEFQKDQNSAFNDISDSAWEILSKKKIFFGHRSVGNNIIAGVDDLIKSNPQIKLKIVETSDPTDFKAGVFAHTKVGENGFPQSKTKSFMKYMDEGFGKKANFSFMKFCFADIKVDSDINAILADYKNVMKKVKNKFPETTFIHVTVPLTTINPTWRTWVKKCLGKTFIWEYDHNVRRNEFNNLLINEYRGNEPVFDLAKFESTLPDGTQSSFTRNGKNYLSMFPGYSRDGGHLNEFGRMIVAEKLLLFLLKLDK